MAPTIRGKSLYTSVNQDTWTKAETGAAGLGGHLVTIETLGEHNYIVDNVTGIDSHQPGGGDTISPRLVYFIGLNDLDANGLTQWSSGSGSSFRHYDSSYTGFSESAYTGKVFVVSSNHDLGYGGWVSVDDNSTFYKGWGWMHYGLAEIPLSLTTTLPTTINEGAGEFTVNIDLSAGATSQRHSLIQGARVWYVVSGIDSSDLETGYTLQGSGVIDANGNIVVDGGSSAGIRLALRNDGIAESDVLGMKFYSEDPTTTTEALGDVQIGTSTTTNIQEGSTSPTITPIRQLALTGDNYAGEASSDGTYLYIPIVTAGTLTISKYSLLGDRIWERTFGGGGQGSSAIAADGSILVASPSEGISGKVSMLARFNSEGDKIWEITDPYARFGGDIVVNGTTVYVSGGTGTGFSSSNTTFVKAYSLETGSLIWSKTYGNSGAAYIGDLEVVGDKIYCAAALYGKADFDTAIAGCLDLNGNEVWWKSAPAPDWNSITAITVVGNQVIGTGYKGDGSDRGDARVISFGTVDGTINWDKSWGDGNFQYPTAITSSDGKIYVAYGDGVPWNSGNSTGGYSAVAEIDILGNLVNTYTYDVQDFFDSASSFVRAGDSLYVLGQTTGVASGQSSGGGQDVYLASLFIAQTPNNSPTDLTHTSTGIDENSAAGTVIGILSADDPDAGSTFTYALVPGTGDTDNNLVEVIDDKVYVESGAVIDFESNSTLDLRIQVTDNGRPALSYTKAFSINVLNVQEGGSIGAITSSTPGIFKEEVTLTAGALTDPDGITGTVTYKWFNGATEVQSGASNTYIVGPQGQGMYRVDAVYVDGTGSTVTTSSATQVLDKVDNNQGTLSSITSSIPATFQEGVTLTAGSITGDLDGNGTITGYQWFFNDVAITVNGSSSFYDVSNTGYGNYKVGVTYKDGQDYITTLTTTNQVVSQVDNGNAAVSITGAATVGTTLTAAITTPDPDGNGTFSYQWQSFDGSTWSNIPSNATGSTYQLTSNELTKQVRVVVTSTDAQAYGPIALYSNTTVPIVTPPDTILPTITDVSVQGSNVILNFSERVQTTGINNSTFIVRVGGTARTVSATNYDSTNQNKVTLTLSGTTAPTSSSSLQVTYSGTNSNVVKDLAGNSLGTFTNRSADTFLSGASVTSLYADYTKLTLTGTSAINGTGNAKNNTIIGNEAKNTINGAAGADVLTGAGGTDTFVYTTLANSLLGTPTNYTFDRITDFAIGQDRIDGPKTVSTSQVQELGTVATLDQAGLQAILTTTRFTANGAATFTYNDNGTLRTFVALNNNVAGFDVTKDAVIEITGASGLLTNLAIV
jgi:hypothetical protein